MKTIQKLILTICASAVVAFGFIGGCATAKTYATPENAKSATILLTGGILSVLQEPERTKFGCNLWAASVGVRAFAEGGDHVPTADELAAAVLTFLPRSARYIQFAEIIRGVWRAALPQIGGNTKTALAWAEAVAEGIDASAKPYCGPQPYGTPIHVSPAPAPVETLPPVEGSPAP